MSQNLLLQKGKQPPQFGIPRNLNVEDMLLYGAWIHGMNSGSIVHRLALFAFVQTHIANKSDESLQAVLERSAYWKKEKDGYYSLNSLALSLIKTKKFGGFCDEIEFGNNIQFKRIYKDHLFIINIDINTRKKMKPQVDGVDKDGKAACQQLRELGVILPETTGSDPKKILNWILRDNDYEWLLIYKNSKDNLNITNFDRLHDNRPILPKEDDDSLSFPEGKETFILHRIKERNKTVVELAKKLALEKDRNLCCQVCNFSFAKVYGELGQGFIEAHHIKPLSKLSNETETKVQDLVLVCSNCHRMLHRKRPWLNINDMQNLIC